MSHLSDNDRQALELARELRANMQQWLARHGASGNFSISPFVDPTGRPNVIVTMDGPLALAMARSLAQQQTAAPQPPQRPHTQQQPLPPPRHLAIPTQASA